MKPTLISQLVATAVAAGALLAAPLAGATGIVQAYTDALKNDPTYRAAIKDNEAGMENKAIARSQLLPNVSANYSVSTNRADYTTPNFLGQLSTTHPNYTSRSAVLQLRQSLLNLEAVAGYFQGVAQYNYSNAQFSARQQDLVVRLVGAYIDAQFAEEQLALLLAQRKTYEEQRAVVQRMFERGEAARTDVLDTEAKYDSLHAQVLEAQDNVVNLRNALAAITGTDIDSVDRLSDKFKVRPIEPTKFEDWREIALQKNAEIDTLRYGVEIQHQVTNKTRAGHAPRVDFIASLSKGDSESLNTLNQESKNRSVGVQVSIPLYSGGYVNATSRQAVANEQKTRADLDTKISQVMVEVRKQFYLTQSSVTKIEALEKAVSSAELAVEATRQSIKAGVRINLDLLNAQTQLFTAKRDLAQGRYNYLIAYLRLRNAAGVLNGDDLEQVASYFAPSTK